MSSGPESQSVQSNRRSFLAGLLATGSAAVGALLAFPLVRFTLHPVLARTTEKSWSDVGSVDEFQNIDAPIKKLVTIEQRDGDRKSTRLNSSHLVISYAVFCLKKKKER